ncbi:MAG: hypothetical protein IJV00_00495 [Clostridia bacterium]|nr:hypothetical protein [Clostridia bacterium]
MLKAGYCRLDVTPPLGSDLSGYFYRRDARGIIDPLYIIALAVSDGEETAVMIAADFIGIDMEHCSRIRAAVSERTGLPEDHVTVSALHQHTAPCITTPEKRLTAIRDEKYVDVLIRKFADAAVMAKDDLKEAQVSAAAAPTAEPIAFVRRYFTKEEGVMTNPSSKLTLLGRCAEADNTVRLVKFARDGANDIALINFATHPDVVSGYLISADWPGYARKYVEESLPGVSAIFFTGFQGDSNHIDFFKPKEERLVNGSNLDHSRFMGRQVANTVTSLWNRTEPSVSEKVFAKSVVIYNRTNDTDAEKYDECKKILDDYRASNATSHGELGIRDLAYVTRIVNLRTAPIFRPVPLSAVGFGDVVFAGIGGEAFTAYIASVKALVPDRFLITAVCTNGYEGYFPTEEAFSQGGYEADSSLFTPTLEKEVVGAFRELLAGI